MSFDPGLPDDRVNVSGTHPLKEAGMLVGGIVGFVVLVTVGTAVSIDVLVPFLPPSLEMQVFGWLSSPPDEDEPADSEEARVQALVDRLASRWPENPYRFNVVILSDTDPNAFAFPGASIGVTRGLLEQVGSENELAFVLGHEIGHFKNRDHLRGLGRGLALTLAVTAVASSGAGVAGNLAALAGTLAARSFDREQEADADAFGMELVAAEYGHVDGAGRFFEKAPDPGGILGEGVAGYLSTHPYHEDRIEALERLADRRGWQRRGDLTPFAGE